MWNNELTVGKEKNTSVCFSSRSEVKTTEEKEGNLFGEI